MDNTYLTPQRDDWWGWINPRDIVLFSYAKSYRINTDAFAILKHFNGRRTIENVLALLHSAKDFPDTDDEGIKKYVSGLVDKGILKPRTSPAIAEVSFAYVGNADTYVPFHGYVELCDACNLKCEYCYRESGPHKKAFLKEPISYISRLYDQGFRVIELSGGEPFMHPEFYDVLKFVCEKFFHVVLITNGTLIEPRVLDVLEKHNRTCVLQVSLPAMTRDRYMEITGKDFWDRVHKNVLLLKGRRIPFRIVKVFRDLDGVQEIREAAHFARSLGAAQFLCQPFMLAGRAKYLSISPQAVEALNREIEKLRKEFPPNFLGMTESEISRLATHEGCVAGTASVTIDPHGRLRPCPHFPADEFSSLGLNDPQVRAKIARMHGPRESICGPCDFASYCGKCFLRGWYKYRETGCVWGKSEHIDEIFSALRTVEEGV